MAKNKMQKEQFDYRLNRLNECFLRFSTDYLQNITRLVSCCGKLLGASSALYNKLDGDLIRCIAGWNVPSDYKKVDKAKNHICTELIRKSSKKPVLIRHLSRTRYAKIDSNISKYNLQTYFGQTIKLGARYTGTLCILYKRDYTPTLEDKRLIGIIASAIAIEDERREMEEQVRISETQFRLAFENAKDAIFWADAETGIILKCNKAAEELLERARKEIIGWHHTKLHPPDKKKYYIERFKSDVRHRRVTDMQAEVITKSGKVKPVRISANVIKIGERLVIQGIFRDITERKRMDEALHRINAQLVKTNRKLQRQALKDPHTGLYNHRYFEEIIKSEFYRAKRYGNSLSLLMLDIDYFRSVNEVYGHSVGDLVLKQFSKKLRRLVRLHDYVIRYGDEEFIVVLPGSDKIGSLSLARRISNNIKITEFGDPQHKVRLCVSIAVVSAPEDRIFKSDDLLELADKIMYRAKQMGGDRVCSSADIGRKASKEMAYGVSDVSTLKQWLEKITRQVNQNLTESVFAFARTLELKDHFTGEHVEKTVYYATETARIIGIDPVNILFIKQAAILHDLGKIGISEQILLKRGRLNKKEFEVIKNHPRIGVDIIRPIQLLHGLIPLILYHHERWDGKGYPCGLRGEEIPLGARIIAVADVYQALISDRPYRKAYPREEAVEIIKAGSGTQFDKKVVDAFLQVVQK